MLQFPSCAAVAVLLLLPFAVGCVGTPERGDALAGRSVDEWSEALEPSPDARAWLDIPWHATFHDGLAAADAADRPLLLWLMNGHPLGCT